MPNKNPEEERFKSAVESSRLIAARSDGIVRGTLASIVETVLQVAQQRSALLQQMRTAFERGDEARVLAVARRLCGLSDEKSGRTDPSVNSREGLR